MEQINIFDLVRDDIEITKPIRLIELFAGYGSQAMALERIGANFEHYRVVEFDKPAIKSYNAVHGTDFPDLDIRNVHGEDLEIMDRDKYTYLMTYSFPCTDISVAGQQKGFAEDSGTRSALLWEVKRILEELKELHCLPDILLMENVVAIHSEENKPHLRKWTDFLEEIGYTSYMQDLNASDYGVAQNRDRTFILSTLGEYNYKFPVEVDLNTCIEDYFEELTDEMALKLIVKSEKAKELLVNLDEEGKLE